MKDESHDITPWLAWYHTLGFDTCIVFDDYSTDGTWEMLKSASLVQDIRLARTIGPRDEHHQVRQSMTYEHSLQKYASEFEWIGFFDSDEYLCLYEDKSIKEFLGRFEAADQIAINWCNYGSNGHYLKPPVAPFKAYTRHSDRGQHVNRHVKSLVRPNKVGQRWFCVHSFDVLPERSFTANGKLVSWGEKIGIIDADPDWSVAKIMHYQCRSMEHFIDRLKKLKEFQGIPKLWNWLDQNQIEDTRPLQRYEAVQSQILKIEFALKFNWASYKQDNR